MIYVSLVGTQVMAVLNPLLGLMSRSERPDRVELLATSQTAPFAMRIKDFLSRDGLFAETDIHLVRVSDSLAPDIQGNPPPQVVFADMVNRSTKIAFNLAGGMNFHLSACIEAVAKTLEKCLLLYPETEGIHAFRVRDGRTEACSLLPLPSPEDVLTLQGVEYEMIASDENPLLKYCRSGCRKLPLYKKHIRIGSVEFDLVKNIGNEMRFLKVIHKAAESSRRADQYREEARALCLLAVGRSAFGELYHRSIALLTNHAPVAERASEESGGKIRVLLSDPRAPKADQNMMLRELQSFFLSGRTVTPPLPAAQEETAIPHAGGSSALYVPLGENIMPSLLATFSHQPERVCFLYTPGVPRVVQHVKRLREAREYLPVSGLSFLPVSVAGAEILACPRPPEKDFWVNITPGTKGQAAFLTYWAKLHGAEIFSIQTGRNRLKGIPGGEGPSVKSVSPLAYLRFSGIGLLNEGESKADLFSNGKLFEAILRFLRLVAQKKPKAITNFPDQQIKLETAASRLLESQTAQITFDAERPVVWSLKNNIWFERLVGYVMGKLQAEHVHVRIRTRWSKKMEQHLAGKKFKVPPFKTDIDVVGQFGGDTYVVSCKATQKRYPGAEAAEISAMASLFGRFAVPLVCFLQYNGPPVTANGVYVFGYRTLVDYEAMRQLLRDAIETRRKTGKAGAMERGELPESSRA